MTIFCFRFGSFFHNRTAGAEGDASGTGLLRGRGLYYDESKMPGHYRVIGKPPCKPHDYTFVMNRAIVRTRFELIFITIKNNVNIKFSYSYIIFLK